MIKPKTIKLKCKECGEWTTDTFYTLREGGPLCMRCVLKRIDYRWDIPDEEVRGL